MDALPSVVAEIFDQSGQIDRRTKIKNWLEKYVLLDLNAYPDCVGGLVLLAPNPVLRSCREYPLRLLEDGREIFGVQVVPRMGQTLDTLSIRLREVRPDGTAALKTVHVDSFGRAEIVLPQRAIETALEVSCARRGLLLVSNPHSFIRSIQVNMRIVNAVADVEIPARRKGSQSIRRSIPSTIPGIISSVGERVLPDAAARLTDLLTTRILSPANVDNELMFMNNRSAAISFVSGLVFGAIQRVIFIDPYFDNTDVREFALSVSSRDCCIGFLTGGDEKIWRSLITTMDPSPVRGKAMKADLEDINRIRKKLGMGAIVAKVMGRKVRTYHDRFLVIDDDVWHFGQSFHALGNGTFSMATKISRPDKILPIIMSDFNEAEEFDSYWNEMKMEQAR